MLSTLLRRLWRVDRPLVWSYEERRCRFEELTRSRISPSILEHTKIKIEGFRGKDLGFEQSHPGTISPFLVQSGRM